MINWLHEKRKKVLKSPGQWFSQPHKDFVVAFHFQKLQLKIFQTKSRTVTIKSETFGLRYNNENFLGKLYGEYYKSFQAFQGFKRFLLTSVFFLDQKNYLADSDSIWNFFSDWKIWTLFLTEKNVFYSLRRLAKMLRERRKN